MPNRFYDEYNEYTEGFLKEYEYWNLEVNYRQHTLGCYVIFCKRPSAISFSSLTDAELLEFKKVCSEIEQALLAHETFTPDRFNYLQMGNKVHYLHVHAIPRYAEPREFLGREWIDPSFKTVPVWKKENESHETINAVRDEILKIL